MKESMTSRERILCVLKGQEPDRIPWSPLVDGYYTQSLKENGHFPDVVQTVREIGADLIERHVPIIKDVCSKVETKIIRKGDEEVHITTTPVGELKQLYKYSGQTKYSNGHRINNTEEMKILQYIYENTIPQLDEQEFKREIEYIGDSGIRTPSMPATPIQTLLQVEMGVEGFTYNWMDYRRETEELMETMHEYNLKQAKLLAQSSAEAVFQYEDTSTTVMSEIWYRNYCFNHIDQYADIFHKDGKIYITHMCGKLKGFMDIIRKNKMDGIDSVCPPTTGDLHAHEALKGFDGKIIIGGIEPPALRRMTVKETEEYVLNIFRSVAPGKNFILSTGDATAYGTPLENLKKVTEVVLSARPVVHAI